MAQIITLQDDNLDALLDTLHEAKARRSPVSLWVDDLDPTGIKVKVGGGIWSLPIGTVEYRP